MVIQKVSFSYVQRNEINFGIFCLKNPVKCKEEILHLVHTYFIFKFEPSFYGKVKRFDPILEFQNNHKIYVDVTWH